MEFDGPVALCKSPIDIKLTTIQKIVITYNAKAHIHLKN